MRLFAGPPAVPARRRRLAAAPLDAPPALPPPRLKEGQWTVAQAQHRLRLDRYLRFALDGASEKSLDRASRAGCIKVNGVVLRLNTEHYVKAGDVVTLAATPAALAAVAAKAVATDWRPRILFEDDVLLVVDKPAGVASVPSRGVAANAVTSLEAFLLRRDAPAPPTTLFPLHRLDQETSGVLMLAKTARVCAPVSRLFRTRGGVEKAYIALLSGSLASPDDEGVWSDLLEVGTDGRARIFDAASAAAHPAAKTAKTAFTVLERGEKFTRIELRPSTGRLHQLRAQAAYRRAPVFGDDRYGRNATLDGGVPRLCLHCERMAMAHPDNAARLLRFVAAVPEELAVFALRLRKAGGAGGVVWPGAAT